MSAGNVNPKNEMILPNFDYNNATLDNKFFNPKEIKQLLES